MIKINKISPEEKELDRLLWEVDSFSLESFFAKNPKLAKSTNFTHLRTLISGAYQNQGLASNSLRLSSAAEYLINKLEIPIGLKEIEFLENNVSSKENSYEKEINKKVLDIIKKRLLKTNINKNYQNDDITVSFIFSNQQKFFEYCKAGDLKAIIDMINDPLLSNFIDTKFANESGKTGLMIAAVHGHIDLVKYLLTSPDLKEHSDINKVDKSGSNAVMLASHHKELEVIKYLLESPELTSHIDINQRDDMFGRTLLFFACNHGNLDLVKYLLKDYKNKEDIDFSIKNSDNQQLLDFLYDCYKYREKGTKNEYIDIFKTLIVDNNLSFNEETMQNLKDNGKEDILNIITKRDTYLKMKQKIGSLRDVKTNNLNLKI